MPFLLKWWGFKNGCTVKDNGSKSFCFFAFKVQLSDCNERLRFNCINPMFRTDYRKHVKDSLEEEKTAFILKYFDMKDEEKINAVWKYSLQYEAINSCSIIFALRIGVVVLATLQLNAGRCGGNYLEADINSFDFSFRSSVTCYF